MVAAVPSLSEGRPAEFTGPDDEGLLENAQLFQVGDESGDRLIDGFAIFVVTIKQVVVLIPSITVAAGAGELDEANPAFDEAASEKALSAEGFGLIKIGV